MTTLLVQRQPPPLLDGAGSASLAALVGSVGEPHFGPAMGAFLHGLCGAERFVGFRLARDELRSVAAGCVQPGETAVEVVKRYVGDDLWRDDAALHEAHRSVTRGVPSVVLHAGFDDRHLQALFSRAYLRVSDRVVLCGAAPGGSFGLSLVSTAPHGPFSSEALGRLRSTAELVVALVAKHAAVMQRSRADEALGALHVIEHCIAASGDLPRREGEVCARILFGMSSAGIAVDLAVSEETVKTYRKRAYQRLCLGSERALLSWYLERWRHRGTGPRC